MFKLHRNEFKAICDFLNNCDIYILSCVNRRFYNWIKKLKLLNHNCFSLKTVKSIITTGCTRNIVETFDINDLFMKYVKAGHLEICRTLLRRYIVKKNMYPAFNCAVRCGHLHICKWIFGNYKINFEQNNYMVLREAAKYGQLEVFIWIHSKIKNKNNLPYDALVSNACNGGNVHICELLTQSARNMSKQRLNRILSFVAINGHIDVCKWILKFYEYKDVHKLLKFSISFGKFDFCKWLMKHYVTPPYTEAIKLFNNVAETGSVEMCKWVISNRLCAVYDPIEAFERAADAGNTELCKWLHQCYKIIDVNKVKLAIHDIIGEGYLTFIQWFYCMSSKFRTQCEQNTEFYIIAASNGHLRTAKWFYSKLTVDDKKTESCLQIVVQKREVDIYKWLISEKLVTKEAVEHYPFPMIIFLK